jgi:hypothetical protein
MKTHAALGADAIERAVNDTHQPVPFLHYAHQIALHHHERWDGSGYPDGLAGDAIPLAARLMAVADVFDALISRRVYKEALPSTRCSGIMAEQRGRHFDPGRPRPDAPCHRPTRTPRRHTGRPCAWPWPTRWGLRPGSRAPTGCCSSWPTAPAGWRRWRR